MQQNDNSFPLQSTSAATSSSQNIYHVGKSRTSLIRVQNQKLRIVEEQNDLGKARRDQGYSASKTDIRLYSRSRECPQDDSKLLRRPDRPSREKVFSNPEFVVSDCWKTSSGEMPVKLIQIFKENCLDEEDGNVPLRRRRLDSEEDNEKLTYTKEFHVLNEVQKARILNVVEDTIRKMANKDMKDYSQGVLEPPPKTSATAVEPLGREKFFCKKFLLPWVIVKVIEMVLCHIIQLTFLSEESYFRRKNEFLPVVLIYYLTLFIIIFSLLIHVTCFSCTGNRNPCYFMATISSSILTLTTTLGILVMLVLMEYYKSFREILVLVFIGGLLISLFAELCLCYIEVKHFWTIAMQTELYYVD